MIDSTNTIVVAPASENPIKSKKQISEVLQEKRSSDKSLIKDHFIIDDNESIGEDPLGTLSWHELSKREKATHISKVAAKIICTFLLLYIFICSLDLLSVGLRILGGSRPTEILDRNVLVNPVVGLMCGILFTIVVQSSSTTSSAVVGLVAGKIIPVQDAIYIIMGANIGTSVTNTLFAMLQVDNKDRFRRAFAAATIHDMFNWLTTLVLLPIESLTSYLLIFSEQLVKQFNLESKEKKEKKLQLIKALTEPLTDKIIKFNDDATKPNSNMSSVVKKDGTLFAGSSLHDKVIGIIVVLIAFIVLLTCLFCIVKTLESLLKGRIAKWIRRFSNADLPYCPFLTEYLLLLMGAVLTFLVQSSSAFTSTLPPLVSVKAISLERAYPLTLGSNLGTTTTAIIAALAQNDNIKEGLQGYNDIMGILFIQIALCHFLFNLTGIVLFFPLPFTRFPVNISKLLGNTTAEYRWFAIFYVVVLFVLLPIIFMGLAFAGSVFVIVAATLLCSCLLFVVIVNFLKGNPRTARFLPEFLLSWDWLPEWMRSLEFYNRLFLKCKCCRKLNRRSISTPPPETNNVEESHVNSDNDGGEGDVLMILEPSNKFEDEKSKFAPT